MLCVLQLDALSRPLVDRLVAEGRMPVLADLHESAAEVELDTPAELMAGSTFHTLYTGVGPATHGLYYAFQWAPEEQRVRHVEDFPLPPSAWERAARAGARCAVLDLYEARRPQAGFDGVVLSGWQFGNRVALPGHDRPAGTRRALARRLGRPQAIEEVFGRPSLRSLEATAARLRGTSTRVADAISELTRSERFDLVWAGFCAAHLGGHWLWDLSQLTQAEREQARRRGLDHALADVYAELDVALGTVLEVLPSDAELIVVSGLGMDADATRSDLLPGMLAAVLGGGAANGSRGDSLWRLRALVPPGPRGAIASALPRSVALQLTARLDLRGVDWSRTRAFALAGDHNGHVRLNLRGREREGIVDPDEADSLLEEIAEGLRSFTDPDGAQCVADVVRAARVYDGPGLALLPDLVVVWSAVRSAKLAYVSSPRFGRVTRPGGRSGTGRSGGHTADAWALVRSSRRLRSDGRATVADVAATVLAAFEASIDGLEGSSLLV